MINTATSGNLAITSCLRHGLEVHQTLFLVVVLGTFGFPNLPYHPYMRIGVFIVRPFIKKRLERDKVKGGCVCCVLEEQREKSRALLSTQLTEGAAVEKGTFFGFFRLKRHEIPQYYV